MFHPLFRTAMLKKAVSCGLLLTALPLQTVVMSDGREANRQAKFQEAKERARRIWLWLSVILTAISSISILEDLKMWRDLGVTALNILYQKMPSFAALIDIMLQVCLRIIEIFRSIFHEPISLFLLSIGIKLSQYFIDLLLIALLYFTGYGRAYYLSRSHIRAERNRSRRYLVDLGFDFRLAKKFDAFPRFYRRTFYNAEQKCEYEGLSRRLREGGIDLLHFSDSVVGSEFSDEERRKFKEDYALGRQLAWLTGVLVIFLLFNLIANEIYENDFAAAAGAAPTAPNGL